MTVRKDKQTGLWLIDISGGVNPVTGKRRRHIKRGIKTRREAITLEHLNSESKSSETVLKSKG